MLNRPGCLTPIAMVFVAGCLLLVAGKMAESTRTLRAGVGCLLGAVVLMAVGIWLRQRGWWE
jgi:hypothetical protein